MRQHHANRNQDPETKTKTKRSMTIPGNERIKRERGQDQEMTGEIKKETNVPDPGTKRGDLAPSRVMKISARKS